MVRSRYIVGLILLIFFVMSFLTNIPGAIIPDIITGFHVSLTVVALLPFFFFSAYGVMSIPAGFLVERYTEKPVMIASFAAGLAGSLGIAFRPSFLMVIVASFVIGAGMASLQVAINPLLRVAGGEEHFAFNSAFAQLVFGAASFLSPRVYSYIVEHRGNPTDAGPAALQILDRLTPANLSWVAIYWIFAAASLAMMVILFLSRVPRVERKADEQAGTLSMYRDLLRKRVVWLFFGCVFAYVASEQGTANWISQFLATYHHANPDTIGANAVSWFWGLLTLGCLLGMFLLKLFDSRHVLIGFSTATLICLTVALFGPVSVSIVAFPVVGFFASIMWPVVSSLALNSVAEHHGSFAGILCTGIVGGAFGPIIIGRLGDVFGLRAGMCFLYLTFGCVLSVGFWAKPLITNATILQKKETAIV
ncbi:MAG TPA: MFS transporter [Candidatus Sulfotelmatobacter sp.]|nr:MFS transporter [Candidatus Sulfotelmatobacter sp.]